MTAELAIGGQRGALARQMRQARRRRAWAFWARLFSHRSFLLGFVLFGAIVVLAVGANILAPYNPDKNDYTNFLAGPSALHWLGTDEFGRDVLSRIIFGTRVSLGVGVGAAIASGLLGTAIGALSGYVRWTDGVIMRCMDGLMAFPGVLLAISLAAALGPSEASVIIALTVTFVPRTARIVRASVIVTSRMLYVEAALAAGAGHLRVLLRYILANALSPLIVQLTYVFAVSILAEAILSFIGVGPPPPAPSLGNIIAGGRTYMQEAPWVTLYPGIAIACAVLGLNLIGDGLRDTIDPRLGRIRTPK
jgi:peptide/nickel transport system permease protein